MFKTVSYQTWSELRDTINDYLDNGWDIVRVHRMSPGVYCSAMFVKYS